MKELLSGRSAAKRLGVSQETVMRWVRIKKLEPFGHVDSGTVVFEPGYIEQKAAELRRPQPIESAISAA